MSATAAAAKLAQQCAPAVFMVHPSAFAYNVETAQDNAFMQQGSEQVAERAAKEHAGVVSALRRAGVQVHLAEGRGLPDECFPNNWVSFHQGTAHLFPMATPSRRGEVDTDLLFESGALPKHGAWRVQDWRRHMLAEQGAALEGTGALVLDRVNRVAYLCKSARGDEALAAAWCQSHSPPYTLHAFQGALPGPDGTPVPVYHTNVLMAVGAHTAVVCPQAVVSDSERTALLRELKRGGREVVVISPSQVNSFAGNMLQLRATGGSSSVWAMSASAHAALTPQQLAQLTAHGEGVVPCAIPTIEQVAGGSVRCLLAEVFPGPERS